MEKILHSEAELVEQQDDNSLSCEQRFAAFMELMAPYYANAPRLQRIYRVDDLYQRTVGDDWATLTTCTETQGRRVRTYHDS